MPVPRPLDPSQLGLAPSAAEKSRFLEEDLKPGQQGLGALLDQARANQDPLRDSMLRKDPFAAQKAKVAEDLYKESKLGGAHDNTVDLAMLADSAIAAPVKTAAHLIGGAALDSYQKDTGQEPNGLNALWAVVPAAQKKIRRDQLERLMSSANELAPQLGPASRGYKDLLPTRQTDPLAEKQYYYHKTGLNNAISILKDGEIKVPSWGNNSPVGGVSLSLKPIIKSSSKYERYPISFGIDPEKSPPLRTLAETSYRKTAYGAMNPEYEYELRTYNKPVPVEAINHINIDGTALQKDPLNNSGLKHLLPPPKQGFQFNPEEQINHIVNNLRLAAPDKNLPVRIYPSALQFEQSPVRRRLEAGDKGYLEFKLHDTPPGAKELQALFDKYKGDVNKWPENDLYKKGVTSKWQSLPSATTTTPPNVPQKWSQAPIGVNGPFQGDPWLKPSPTSIQDSIDHFTYHPDIPLSLKEKVIKNYINHQTHGGGMTFDEFVSNSEPGLLKMKGGNALDATTSTSNPAWKQEVSGEYINHANNAAKKGVEPYSFADFEKIYNKNPNWLGMYEHPLPGDPLFSPAKNQDAQAAHWFVQSPLDLKAKQAVLDKYGEYNNSTPYAKDFNTFAKGKTKFVKDILAKYPNAFDESTVPAAKPWVPNPKFSLSPPTPPGQIPAFFNASTTAVNAPPATPLFHPDPNADSSEQFHHWYNNSKLPDGVKLKISEQFNTYGEANDKAGIAGLKFNDGYAKILNKAKAVTVMNQALPSPPSQP
jgi:hypothetical protein